MTKKPYFSLQESSALSGHVSCEGCSALSITLHKEDQEKSEGKPALYRCGARNIALKSKEPAASLSRVPGILGMLAGNQVIITDVQIWEPSFICPNNDVKRSVK